MQKRFIQVTIMKKIVSIITVLVMTLWMPIYSLANEGTTITQDSQEKSGNTNIDYNIEETYTVIFPASVTFTDNEKTVERSLQASNVKLKEGSVLNVNVASPNNFNMVNGEAKIGYKLYVNYNADPVENNHTVVTVIAGENVGLAILNFVMEPDNSNSLYAGHYTDTLTFTVSVE